MKTMDPGSWSPYSQQPFTHGSPHNSAMPPPTPADDSLNSFASATLLLSPCQGLSHPSRPGTAEPSAQQPSTMLNSHFDSSTLLSPPISTSKETTDFFGDNLFNGVCKESQPTIPDFIQTASLPASNESLDCLPPEDSNSGFHSQPPPPPPPPPVPFQPKSIERPSPGPFGVLPHESVMPRPTRYERCKEKFAKPVFNNNGPGFTTDQDGNNVYTSTPHSVFPNENTSRSPIVNSVTSPNMSNFSSPSDYYSSPKNNFGAYNNVQSPMPQSPSVAAHSYPSSPFTSLDHIPPCSPIGSASYMNKLQQDRQVPQRSNPKSQHSPGSNMCYNPPQPQSGYHHGHQTPGAKAPPDYHTDYNMYPHNHVASSSYPSPYSTIHNNQMPCEDTAMASQPLNSHAPMSHENRHQYSHSTTSISSPTYMQSKPSNAHDMMYGPTSMSTSQPMHQRTYDACASVIDPINNHSAMHNNHHNHQNSVMPPMMNNDRPYSYPAPDMNNDKNALDMFNSHLDSGVPNPDNCQSSISSFLENELPALQANILAGQDLNLNDPNAPPPQLSHTMNMNNMGEDLSSSMPNFNNVNPDLTIKNNINYNNSINFSTNSNICPINNMIYQPPVTRGRGRRGRRRRADIHNRGSYCRQYQKYKNERNSYYANGYQVEGNKFSEFTTNNCFMNNDYRNASATTPTNNDSYNQYQTSYKDRIDAYEFHTPCYTPSKYQSLRKKDPNRGQSSLDILEQKPKKFFSVEEELCFLGELTFPRLEVRGSSHTFMKTRNKDLEGFLQSYKNFLELRKNIPDEEIGPPVPLAKEHHKHSTKELHEEPRSKPKLIIKMGRCRDHKGWQLTSPVLPLTDESNSSDSKDSNMSSHKVSDDSDAFDRKSVEKSNKGNSEVASEKASKHSAKRIFKCIGRNKSSDYSNNYVSNSDTLPVGNASQSEKPAPKKRGRKAKNAAASPTKKHSTTKSGFDDPLKTLLHPIKEEILSDEEVKPLASRRSSLRLKREDTLIKEEPQPGPSIKIEPVDISSDSADNSDTDPAWTPSCRVPRPLEFAKAHGVNNVVVKKRRRSGKGRGQKRAKKDPEEVGDKPRKGPGRRPKNADPDIKIKTEKTPDLFVILKADLDKETPSIWRVDLETRMIQRFDAHEESDMLVYRNTYAYAAWNEVTRNQYVQVRVKVLSFSRVLYAVQYLGLEDASNLNKELSDLVSPHPLRESFEIYLQTLISQAVDEKFLSAIVKENDEYFLSNINKIEKVTQEKKDLLLKNTWEKELKECAELYPCVNILSCEKNDGKMCQVCSASKVEKLVQFYGPPYDSITLGSTGSQLLKKPQFNMCSICSTAISLYSRLHHQKYNFFIECRGKVVQFQRHKGINDKVAAFHDVLDHCLHDSKWISMLFHELEEVWNQCDKIS